MAACGAEPPEQTASQSQLGPDLLRLSTFDDAAGVVH